MGVDPLSLAMIGSAIYGGVQMSKKPPSQKPMSPPAEEIDETGKPTKKKRKRGTLMGMASGLDLGHPSLGVAGRMLS